MASKKRGNQDQQGYKDPDGSGDTLDPSDEYLGGAQGAAGANPEIRDLHGQIETALFAREAPQSLAASEVFRGPNNIVGVGIGRAGSDLHSDGEPGAAAINIYVAEKTSVEDARRAVVDGFGVRALSRAETPVNVIHTGIIETYPHRHRERPSPNGISIGNINITAGTQGVLTRGRSGERVKKILILSNNHVLANCNQGKKGEAIVQPGPLDGGTAPADTVAVLEQFVHIKFDGTPNYVDCATGWAWADRVRKDFLYRSGGEWRYVNVSSTTKSCSVDLNVSKSGRTTQLTHGRIIDCNASVPVDFGGGRTANFRDQISIKGHDGDFSAGGDSGSLIWTSDAERNPVGLLFAGGNGITFANKIDFVLDALDINLDT